MRKADVWVGEEKAGVLEEIIFKSHYRFSYADSYDGQPVSLTMPTAKRTFEFDKFPPFFEGLLPEGVMLEALLKIAKIDRNDFFSQLVEVGEDMIGNVTVRKQQ